METNNKAQILYQIKVEGILELQSPLRIGAGDLEGSAPVDVQVLKNDDEQPFIPGTSLAGVLRSDMKKLVHTGSGSVDELFGHISREGTDDVQSAVAIDDILLENAEIAIRDGVSIDPYTGIAKSKAKYDYEVVERGAKGPFTMLITIRRYFVDAVPQWQSLIDELVGHLCHGFRVGSMTAKGFGKAVIKKSTIQTYDFSDFKDICHWLKREAPEHVKKGKGKKIIPANTLTIRADFFLKTSLLIRSSEITDKDIQSRIHAVPLKSKGTYLIPGTSVKGVLRHQAGRILRTMGKPENLLDDLMGFTNDSDTKGKKSRFLTDEIYLQDDTVKAVKQTRNAIDKITGNTMDSRLFTEKVLYPQKGKETSLTMTYAITDCHDAWEIGLALFLLKDLWTGQVALGGDKAVGRGYLQGIRADISYRNDQNVESTWHIIQPGKVDNGDAAALEQYAQALVQLTAKGDA